LGDVAAAATTWRPESENWPKFAEQLRPVSLRPIPDASIDDLGQQLRIGGFAFPNHRWIPAQGQQIFSSASIPLDVSVKLRLPVVDPGLWHGGPRAPLVPVPEASMDEQSNLVLRKHEVRRAWQIAAVQAKSQPQRVRGAADAHLRLRVLAPNARHCR